MRIAVYAICKNESQFVDRWMDSMSEADQVVVLDTGSTDDTVERLKKRGAQVTVELISPWRFDVARNRSLDLVSEDTDICVRWSGLGSRGPDRRPTAILGVSTLTAARGWPSGMKRPMPGTAISGYTRSTRSLNGWARGSPALP